jgi:putative NADH-flavin reductase
MKIAIFGASGFTGSAILNEAVRRRHNLSVLGRDAARFPEPANWLQVVSGDALDREAVARTIQGCDAVIQCLGVGGKGNGKPTTLISEATRIIVAEMQRQGIRRLVALSNVGAGDSRRFQPWIFRRLILPYFMKWLKVIIDDKNRMEPVIMESSLDWTIIRCPNIEDKPSQDSYNATLDGKQLKLFITLDDMAACVMDCLEDRLFVRQAPCISN